MIKLLDFYAEWCCQCKAQSNIVDQLEGIEVDKIDVDTNIGEEWVEKLKIRNLPVLALVDNENNVISVKRGLTQITELNNWISDNT